MDDLFTLDTLFLDVFDLLKDIGAHLTNFGNFLLQLLVDHAVFVDPIKDFLIKTFDFEGEVINYAWELVQRLFIWELGVEEENWIERVAIGEIDRVVNRH
jgi:hypothetical protein